MVASSTCNGASFVVVGAQSAIAGLSLSFTAESNRSGEVLHEFTLSASVTLFVEGKAVDGDADGEAFGDEVVGEEAGGEEEAAVDVVAAFTLRLLPLLRLEVLAVVALGLLG